LLTCLAAFFDRERESKAGATTVEGRVVGCVQQAQTYDLFPPAATKKVANLIGGFF